MGDRRALSERRPESKKWKKSTNPQPWGDAEKKAIGKKRIDGSSLNDTVRSGPSKTSKGAGKLTKRTGKGSKKSEKICLKRGNRAKDIERHGKGWRQGVHQVAWRKVWKGGG